MEERLQKAIAKTGLCSRRKAEEHIEAGRIKVNNIIIKELGYKVNENDLIYFDDKLLSSQKSIYILLNKPKNTISSVSDDRGIITVIDIINNKVHLEERVFPIGRLDYDTTGVLLITNNGDLTNKLIHPSKNIYKTYLVTINGKISEKEISILTNGVKIDNKFVKPDKLTFNKYNQNQDHSILEITLHEGMNHVVKNIFLSINKKVIKLNRIEFAGFTTKGLREGEFRFLDYNEIKHLF